MDNTKILTISIAGYNIEKYVSHTLDTLLDDRILEDIEILVCDDGGKDRTAEIVEEYHRRYPQTVFLEHKENGGYGSVINHNVRVARGKYFKQLDGDDWYDTENLVALVDKLKNVEADCIISPVSIYNEGKQIYTLFDHYPNCEEGVYRYEDVTIENYNSMHGTAFRTQLLKDIDINITEHCFYTDIEYVILPMKEVQTLFISHLPIYIYRVGVEGQSISIDGISRHYKEHEKVFWKMVAYCNSIETTESNKLLSIRLRLKKELFSHIKYLCLLPVTKQSYNELVTFIKRAKNDNGSSVKMAPNYRKMEILLHLPAFTWYIPLHFYLNHKMK